MRQLTFFKYATAVLLLINVAMIAFFILTQPGGPDGPHPRGNNVAAGKQFERKAIAILGLEEEQQTAFIKLAHGHALEVDKIDRAQQKVLQPYFESIIDSSQVAHKEKFLAELQQLEKYKVEYTYQHFKEVQALLKPEQQGNFKTFVRRALEVILVHNKKPKRKDS